jgi:hypothetical protein
VVVGVVMVVAMPGVIALEVAVIEAIVVVTEVVKILR